MNVIKCFIKELTLETYGQCLCFETHHVDIFKAHADEALEMLC